MTAHAFEDRRQQARNDQPHSTGSGQRGTLYPQQKPSQRHPRQNPQPESVKPEVEAETPEVDEQLKPSETIMQDNKTNTGWTVKEIVTVIALVAGPVLSIALGPYFQERHDAPATMAQLQDFKNNQVSTNGQILDQLKSINETVTRIDKDQAQMNQKLIDRLPDPRK